MKDIFIDADGVEKTGEVIYQRAQGAIKEPALRVSRESYDNLEDLVLIEKYVREGNTQKALPLAHKILERHDSVEIRNLLGDLFQGISPEESRIHRAKALEYALSYEGVERPGLSASTFLGDVLFKFDQYDKAYKRFNEGFNMTAKDDEHRRAKIAYCKNMMEIINKKMESRQADVSEGDTPPRPIPVTEVMQAIEYTPTEPVAVVADPDADNESLRYIAEQQDLATAKRKKLGYAAGIVAVIASIASLSAPFYKNNTKPSEVPTKPKLVQPYIAPATPPEVKDFEFYTVKKDDNLWKIAEKKLGSGKEYVKIAQASGLKGRMIIHEGDKLIIPLGKRMYTITNGDTLSGISYKTLGDASLWPEIHKANKASIGNNPDIITPGITITIPKVGKKYVSTLDNDFVFGYNDADVINSYSSGASAKRIARESGRSAGEIYSLLAGAKTSGDINYVRRWDRKLAQATGDLSVIKGMLYDGSARQVAAKIKQETGFSVSESTIYRMRKSKA